MAELCDFYAKRDAGQSTLLKQNKEGCTEYPCNGYSVTETLATYQGTCGNSGTRTGGAQSRHFQHNVMYSTLAFSTSLHLQVNAIRNQRFSVRRGKTSRDAF